MATGLVRGCVCAALALVFGACRAEETPREVVDVRAVGVQPLMEAPLASAARVVARADAARREGEVVVALGASAEVLVGEVLALPAGSDAPRLLHIWRVAPDGARRQVLGGAPLQDARLLPDGRIVAISRGHELVIEGREGVARRLDGPVRGPLSLDARGARLAYLYGEAPALEPRVLTLGHKADEMPSPRPIRLDHPTAWGVALSPDGQRLRVVVGGASPTLAELSLGGLIGRWDLRAPQDALPSGPHAPIWFEGVVLQETERGLLLRCDDGALVQLQGALPVRVPELPDHALVHADRRGGAVRLVAIKEVARCGE